MPSAAGIDKGSLKRAAGSSGAAPVDSVEWPEVEHLRSGAAIRGVGRLG